MNNPEFKAFSVSPCIKCGATNRNKRGDCKSCRNAGAARHYRENKAAKNAYHALLHQSRKGDAEYMQRLRDKSRAYRLANPHKTVESNAKRRAINPEKSRAQSREWFAKNPEKRVIYQQNRDAKINSSGKLSTDLIPKLLKMQRGMCVCCGEPLGKDYHVDHINPLALGGLNVDENMQLLTATCNMQKHKKHPIEFMQSRGFLL